jgi:hypothetical protein
MYLLCRCWCSGCWPLLCLTLVEKDLMSVVWAVFQRVFLAKRLAPHSGASMTGKGQKRNGYSCHNPSHGVPNLPGYLSAGHENAALMACAAFSRQRGKSNALFLYIIIIPIKLTIIYLSFKPKTQFLRG